MQSPGVPEELLLQPVQFAGGGELREPGPLAGQIERLTSAPTNGDPSSRSP
jgi:hypothetical protein